MAEHDKEGRARKAFQEWKAGRYGMQKSDVAFVAGFAAGLAAGRAEADDAALPDLLKAAADLIKTVDAQIADTAPPPESTPKGKRP